MHNIIREAWPSPKRKGKRIEIPADRQTLAKRRWLGTAEDGTQFGLVLEHPLTPDTVVMETGAAHYVLAQLPEPVLEIPLKGVVAAAQIAWSLGNLHFPVQIERDVLRVTDDPATRLYLKRAGLCFHATKEIFRPIQAAGHSHGHTH